MAGRTLKRKRTGVRMGRRNREELRRAAARRRRRTTLAVVGGAAFLVLLMVAVIVVNIRNSRPVGAERSVPTQGNSHIARGALSPIEYNTTPPTSGPHYGGLAPWGVSTQPVRYEQILHNLEDGAVAVYYQCPEGCPELVDALSELVEVYARAGRKVLLVPNDPSWTDGGTQPVHRDMGGRIALTAWQRIDVFDEFDEQRIRAFIERYEGRDNHR